MWIIPYLDKSLLEHNQDKTITYLLLSNRSLIDVIFVSLVIFAVVITSIIIIKVLTDNTEAKRELSDSNKATNSSQTSDKDKLNLKDSDTNADLQGGKVILDSQLIVNSLHDSSPIVLPITWGAVIGTLIWRGKTRSQWGKQGYDYDTFKLVAKMRGSPTRIRLMNAVIDEQKNKLQIAKELDVDWKTVDNHVRVLIASRLIEEITVGASKYYLITEDGRKILSLLSNDQPPTE